jgi:hypothetical protein
MPFHACDPIACLSGGRFLISAAVHLFGNTLQDPTRYNVTPLGHSVDLCSGAWGDGSGANSARMVQFHRETKVRYGDLTFFW